MRLLIVFCAMLVPLISRAIVPDWIENGPDTVVKPITTTIHYTNGELQRNRGTGFVVGRRFYTAFHNIQAASQEILTRHIVIGGVRVEPAAVDIQHDLAVFELPPELCDSWCNSRTLNVSPTAGTDTVAWIRLNGDSPHWKQGRVNNVAFKSVLGNGGIGGCEDNLVIEIDQPFISGSSGGPVFDANSGAIVGIIQGSFETSSGQVTGYYKPLECVAARFQKIGFVAH